MRQDSNRAKISMIVNIMRILYNRIAFVDEFQKYYNVANKSIGYEFVFAQINGMEDTIFYPFTSERLLKPFIPT